MGKNGFLSKSISIVALSAVLFLGSRPASALEECVERDLSVSMDVETREFDNDVTKKVPCMVDPDYRTWTQESQYNSIGTQMAIQYTSEEGKRYYEIWVLETGRLKMLIADRNYFNWSTDKERLIPQIDLKQFHSN